MTDEVGDLILERLWRMDGRLGNIEGDMHDMKSRMTVVEEHIGNLVLSVSGLNSRMDRFDERPGRVEPRLELREGA